MVGLLRSEEPILDYLFLFTWPIPTRPIQRLQTTSVGLCKPILFHHPMIDYALNVSAAAIKS